MSALISDFLASTSFGYLTSSQIIMMAVGALLLYLGIVRKFEPLLLVPIGFTAILVNVPLTGLLADGGLVKQIYYGVQIGLFPPLIFMGVGAMTDFGPLLANPKTFLLGAAAQVGIFGTLIGAKALGFTFAESASVAIIGGADGPTAIFLTSQLAPHLLGAVAVAAYSYMALVPIIQPPIIRLLTSPRERAVMMPKLKPVSKRVKVLFPIITTGISVLVIPASAPLIGMLMLGNLFRESGVVERLSETAQNELVNIVTIFLGIAVGSKMTASAFLTTETLLIIGLGLIAFAIGTASGVLFGKLMHRASGGRVNPIIGAAGVSAVPMAARVAQNVGNEDNTANFLLMNAMGPNVAGVIGSAIAAGLLLSIA